MKRTASFLLAAVIAASCINPLGMISGSTNADFDIEKELWAVSGFTAPYGQQEIQRMHYRGDDELVPAEVTFKNGKMTLVFPSGAYRTIGYTLDRKAKTISFDAPVTYGCTVRTGGQEYVGSDVTFAKYEMMTLSMNLPGNSFNGEGKFFSIYDPSASSYSDVDINRQQWRFNLVNMQKLSLEPLYEIKGEYGTMSQGVNLGVEGAPKWSSDCIYGDATFPWVPGIDLCTVHYGPQWRLPTEADAKWLLENCNLLRVHDKDYDQDRMYFVHSNNKSISFPCADVNQELGFWLSAGKALVYKATDPRNDTSTEARIITPGQGTSLFLRPVKR